MTFFESIVSEYNKKFGYMLKLAKDSTYEFFLPHIKNEKGIIYIDNKTIILLILYLYGDPKLYHIYRLIYALYSYRYYDKCIELLSVFEQINKSINSRVENFKDQDSYRIIIQLEYLIFHELAHFSFHNNLNYKQALIDCCKQLLQRQELLICMNDDMKQLYNQSLNLILVDERLLEELAADLSAFYNIINHLELANCGPTKNAIVCASCISSIYFIEYAGRVERLYFDSPNHNDNIERFNNKIRNEINGSFEMRLRLLLIDLSIRDLWKKYPIAKKEHILYTSLITPIIDNFNENIDIDLNDFISPYYEIFKLGGSIDINQEKKKYIEEQIELFNKYLITQLNNSLSKREISF